MVAQNDDDDDNDLVQRRVIHDFQSLSSKQSRRAVLSAILDDLTSDEWRVVKTRSDIVLQYDVVGSLPLELVLEVARYLDPIQVWTIRGVSRRWRIRFTSQAIYREIFFPFFPFPLSSNNGQVKTVAPEDIMRCNYGLPRSRKWYLYPRKLALVSNNTKLAQGAFTYCSCRIAWLTADKRAACVRDFTTGAFTDYVTETRGVIDLLHLSEHFLFASASGYCTVWDLQTQQSHSIRLPSPHIIEINARHDRAVIIIGSSNVPIVLLSWHFDSNSVRSVYLEGSLLLTSWSQGSNVLSVIKAEHKAESKMTRLLRQRFAVADNGITTLDTKTLMDDQNLDIDFEKFLSFPCFNQFMCRYGTVTSQMVRLKSSWLNWVHVFITYSTEKDVLAIRAPTSHFEHFQCDWHSPGTMLTVDGTIYHIRPEHIATVLPYIEVRCFRHNDDVIPIFSDSSNIQWPPLHELIESWFYLFGDHRLFGIARTTGVDVWTFDRELKLFSDDNLIWETEQSWPEWV